MTYKELKRMLTNKTLPIMGRNQDGEPVLIEEGRNEDGHLYQLSTSQDNGWLRINTYYEDGSIDETYSK